MRIDAAGEIDAHHLGPVLRIAEHALGGDHAGTQDRLRMVDVGEEQVERAHALDETGFEPPPFIGGNDPRHQVERDQAFGARVLAVHRERDADAVECALRLLALVRDAFGRRALQPVGERTVVRPDAAVGKTHFVVRQDRHGFSRNALPELSNPQTISAMPLKTMGGCALAWRAAAPGPGRFPGMRTSLGRPETGKAFEQPASGLNCPPPTVVKSRLLSGFAGRLAQR